MVQLTKKAIVEAFVELLNETSFDKISVVDIAGRCGINRNTFYYHYPDIYALVDELFRTETQKIVELNENYDSWQEGFLQAVRFARANKKAIYHIYNSINRDRLEKYLYDVTLNSITAFVNKHAEDLYVSEKDVNALSVFYTAALIGLVKNWLQDSMRMDLEDYIDEMGRLLDGNIRYTLSKSDERNRLGKEEKLPENRTVRDN
jgi:probable dihydroxyacetone kinase regulator